jgi:hypothetical protein
VSEVTYYSLTNITITDITDTMGIIRTHRKGKHLNTLEKYYIYIDNKDNLQINDTNIDARNPIFKYYRKQTPDSSTQHN